MHKNKTPRKWFPFYIQPWLDGSTRDEFTNEERAIFSDLLALSKLDDGFIRTNEGAPYSMERLAGRLMSKRVKFEEQLELVARVIEICLRPDVGKLRTEPDGTLYMVSHEDYELSERRTREIEAAAKAAVGAAKPAIGSGQPPENSSKTATILDKIRLDEIREEKIKDIVDRALDGPAPSARIESLLRKNFQRRPERLWIIERVNFHTLLRVLEFIKPKWRIIFAASSHRWFGITREDKEAWVAAYKAVDVGAAILQAGEWLVTNPERDKFDYASFLGNWLAREQRSGGRFRGQGQGEARPKPGWAAAREKKP